MKHILNNLSDEEKKSILEQHSRQNRISEFFDTNRTFKDDAKYANTKLSKDLSKVIMTLISFNGREKTSELLRAASEMILQSENPGNPNNSDYDYRSLDLTSDIENYLNEE
jgi:hypothetical protein